MDERTSAQQPSSPSSPARRVRKMRVLMVALVALALSAGTFELAAEARPDRYEHDSGWGKRAHRRWRKSVSDWSPKDRTTTTTQPSTPPDEGSSPTVTTAVPSTTVTPSTSAPGTSTSAPATTVPSKSSSTTAPAKSPSTTPPAKSPSTTAPSLPSNPNGRVFVVAQNGSDSAAGTQDAPFRTVGKGLTALKAGDTLLIRSGTYVENIRSPHLNAGTASARIRVAAYPGERPVIQGLLWLTQANYWTIDGLRVTWNPSNGSNEHMVKLTNGVGWELVNSELYGARSYAALLVAEYGGELRNWRVANNCIRDTQPSNNTNQDHLIYVNSGSGDTSGVIERNLLFNATNGEGVKLGGVSAAEAVQGITLRNNTISNTSQSVLVAGSSKNVVIDRNIMSGTTNGRNHVRGYGDAGAQVQVTRNVYNDQNLFVWSDSGAIQPGAGNQERDPQFASRSCSGFVPTDSTAAAAGRWAN